jgi:hypothetical protein
MMTDLTEGQVSALLLALQKVTGARNMKELVTKHAPTKEQWREAYDLAGVPWEDYELSRLNYLVAETVMIAEVAARNQGWRARGRTLWHTPDGSEVRYIGLLELAIVEPGMTVYVVGKMPAELRRINRVTVIAL